MKSKVLIIDGNNMLYRAYYKYNTLRNDKGKPTGIIYGFPYILAAIIKQQLPEEVIVVFDGGRDKKRLEIFPEYKSNRSKKISFDADNFYEQRDVVIDLLSYLGINTVLKKDKEADDIIWVLTRNLKRRNYEVVIVSSDKDFKQLISSGVSVWSPKDSKRYTHLNMVKETGLRADQIVDYLILDGDKSDNIPGMPMVGEKTAMAFLNDHSIAEYLVSNDKELPLFKRDRLEEVFLRNRKLIDIRRFVRNYIKLKDIVIKVEKSINHKKINLIASKYGITTFATPAFIGAFEKLLKRNKHNTLWPKS